jgi:hypothetical protein
MSKSQGSKKATSGENIAHVGLVTKPLCCSGFVSRFYLGCSTKSRLTSSCCLTSSTFSPTRATTQPHSNCTRNVVRNGRVFDEITIRGDRHFRIVRELIEAAGQGDMVDAVALQTVGNKDRWLPNCCTHGFQPRRTMESPENCGSPSMKTTQAKKRRESERMIWARQEQGVQCHFQQDSMSCIGPAICFSLHPFELDNSTTSASVFLIQVGHCGWLVRDFLVVLVSEHNCRCMTCPFSTF